jgi:ferric-dicitrate binding protein FerR (iron transport regulator)
MNKITEQQFYDLLSLKLSGDATARELELLQEQLLLNPQWQFLYDQMMRPYTHLTDVDLTHQAFAAHFVKMQLQGKLKDSYAPVLENLVPVPENQPAERPLNRKLAFAGVAAASIIGVVFLLVVHQRAAPSSAASLNEIATKKGSKSNIKLPDGTEVWLNADSKLSYKENFSGNTREVMLVGEAYFDVARDISHPFIIHTGKASIRVLGTVFNVRNYPQEKSIETTLMHGKIEVSYSDLPKEKIILQPFQKLIVMKEIDEAAKSTGKNSAIYPAKKVELTSVTYSSTDSLIAETSWLDDKMVFVNQPLEKIAQELERHFAVTILFENPRVKGYRYTGVFSNESIDKILQILQLSKNITYTIHDKKIIIQ